MCLPRKRAVRMARKWSSWAGVGEISGPTGLNRVGRSRPAGSYWATACCNAGGKSEEPRKEVP